MNENIDLTKILEGCPEGTKFYCDIIDKEVEFYGLELKWKEGITFHDREGFSIVDCDTLQFFISVNEYGSICYNSKRPVIFPSKDQRDWSKFERFWDKPKYDNPKVEKFRPVKFQPFDKILVRDNSVIEKWKASFFNSVIFEKTKICYCTDCSNHYWNQAIPYNEDTKNLADTTIDCPEYYKWWEE